MAWNSNAYDPPPTRMGNQFPHSNYSAKSEKCETNWGTRDNRNGLLDQENLKYVEGLYREEGSSGIHFNEYEKIPVETSEEFPEIDLFTDIEVHDALLANLERMGYKKPTPVQKWSVPISIMRRDLMACAQTGSGKTAAFLFPMFAKMLKDGPPDPIKRREAYPIGLILEPTRELAVQTHQEALKFAYKTGIRCVVVYGGTDIPTQEREIRQGIDILVATPGRLIDFLERRLIDLTIVRYLILDEGDRMLDMGFEPQIRRILQAMHGNDHETIMCSATFPEEMKKIAATFMKNYVYLAVGRVGSTSDNITQKVYRVEDHDKNKFLFRILKDLQGLTLIFVEKKRGVDYVFHELTRQGFSCASIHGDKSQSQRERALDDFKHSRVQILVATDVASRGLDIPNIENVINYDTPNYIDHYVHRIGRTGRIGKNGNAFSFVNDRCRTIFKDLISLFRENKQEIPGWFEDMAMGRSTSKYSELPEETEDTQIPHSYQNDRRNEAPYEHAPRSRGRGYNQRGYQPRGGYEHHYDNYHPEEGSGYRGRGQRGGYGNQGYQNEQYGEPPRHYGNQGGYYDEPRQQRPYGRRGRGSGYDNYSERREYQPRQDYGHQREEYGQPREEYGQNREEYGARDHSGSGYSQGMYQERDEYQSRPNRYQRGGRGGRGGRRGQGNDWGNEESHQKEQSNWNDTGYKSQPQDHARTDYGGTQSIGNNKGIPKSNSGNADPWGQFP